MPGEFIGSKLDTNITSPLASSKNTCNLANNPFHALNDDNDESNDFVADTGCTLNLCDRTTPLLQEEPTPNGVLITTASSHKLHGTSKGFLPFALPRNARLCHRVPTISKPLLSIGQACDADCTAVFTTNKMTIHKNTDLAITYQRNAILEGNRGENGLWMVPIPKQNLRHEAHSAYHQKSMKHLAAFHHAAAGYPPAPGFIKAIKAGWFATWTGLTSKLIANHLDLSESTIAGHMKRRPQGLRSTSNSAIILEDTNERLEPPRSHINRQHEVGVSAFPMDALKGLICTDLPGRFPKTSSKGMNYIFLLYDFDSNAILAHPIQSRKTANLIEGYDACYKQLVQAGIKPVIQRLDNEISKELIKSIEAKDLQYQLATPYDHRNNLAERAIQTFKSHFISVLNGCDDNCPAHLWCRLLFQTVATLNMLRPSRINPKLSAYMQLVGNFNFNATPLAPLGTKAIIYVDKKQRTSTWGSHGHTGWYIGPSMNHYRNYHIYVTHTRDSRHGDTVAFFPTKFTMPETSSNDRAAAAIEDLVDALRNPAPASPFLNMGTTTNDAIRQLQALIKKPTSSQKDTTTHRTTQANAHVPPRMQENHNALSPRVIESQPAPRVRKEQARRRSPRLVELTNNEPDQRPMSSVSRRRVTTRHANALSTTLIADEQSDTIANSTIKNLDHLAHHANEHCYSVTHHSTRKQMEYRHLIKDPHYKVEWLLSCANEFGRLAQGIKGRVAGTNTIFFIHKHQMPKGKRATFGRTVCTIRPEKEESNRTRITAMRNLITDYEGPTSTETAGLETIKTHWNSVISTPGARWMGMDIGNMYLNTNLAQYEYMKFEAKLVPQEIIDVYNLQDKIAPDGFLYVEVRKAIYGLVQSGRLSDNKLSVVLANQGYHQSKYTPGLFLHETRPISFTLVVDDFGVKYTNKEDALHLERTISEHYPLKCDWKGRQYIGINLKWDYKNRTLQTTMDGYVKRALLQFQHTIPKQHHYAPSKYHPPKYGAKQQMTKIDKTAPMDKVQKRLLQQVTGKFLYYSRAINDTMMHALNDLAASVNEGTQETAEAVTYFLNYCASNQDAIKMYRASDMILTSQSDAAYLVARQARSRAGGFHYLGNKDKTILNGSISVIATIIKNVMASAAEAEIGALFINARHALPIRVTLIELGHPQPATPLETDNSTANGIMNKTVKQNRSKEIDMRFYWLQDQVPQGQFVSTNLSNYPTKHHSTYHHRQIRSAYLHSTT